MTDRMGSLGGGAHKMLEIANAGLTDIERFVEEFRDTLFNMADDIRAQVPDSQARQATIARIEKMRRKL
jgi:hypothetical protein